MTGFFQNKKYYLAAGLILLLAVSGILFFRYSRPIRTIKEYNAWLNSKNNGCIANREIAGIITTVKYQPPAYVVLKEIAGIEKHNSKTIDSLLKRQQHFMTFLMTITPDSSLGKEKRGAVMYEGVNNYGEYVERVMATNFSMEQYISLYIDGKEIHPLISIVENVYELSEGRHFIILFPNDNKEVTNKSKDFLFVYNDPFFQMGKVQFDFAGKNLDKACDLKIDWN